MTKLGMPESYPLAA